LYKTVEILADGDNWKAPTLGKLEDLSALVLRADGTELYGVFDTAKAEQAKALFAWACGDGLKRPSRDDIHNRVLELTDLAKYAERQAKQASKAQESGDATDDEPDADEPEAPENLIPTDAKPDATRPGPGWKDVPDGTVALLKEACKQRPGHAGDTMSAFARQLVWTTAMVKGLLDGIADSADADRAQEALQELVNNIGEEYGIFPQSEVADAA
jgi:hypothetical protein